MSTRPSARNNDPGYFYDPKRTLQLFAVLAGLLVAGLLAMIWADFDRPWKDQQRDQMKWDARKMALEQFVLQTETQDLRAELSARRTAAQKALDEKEVEIAELDREIIVAEGAFAAADMREKSDRQEAGRAAFEADHAGSKGAVPAKEEELREWQDRNKRNRAAVEIAAANLSALTARRDRLREEISAIVAEERKSAELKRLQILETGIEKKRDYSPLREIPLLDFLAPPTKVEQVVLDHLVDNYEFATPKRVDRCATCHVGINRLGFEADKWPVEILDLPAGDAEKVEEFEEAVYKFVVSLVESVTPKVAADDPFPQESAILRELDIHHRALGIMFLDYDEDEGLIATDEKTGRKIWRRWSRDENERWVSGKEGQSIAEHYLSLLRGMDKVWRTHPFFDDMVGDQSPHPYETVGCTICHQGRGWSVDFGFAYHTPDRLRIENWMTTEWAEAEHRHLPANVMRPLDAAMKLGAPEGVPTSVGWVENDEKGHRWEEELGWVHRKRHHWVWPQLPKMLVQASCLKCHKEGYLDWLEEEYADVQLGPPDPDAPDTLDYEIHAKKFNPEDDSADRLYIPEDKPRYEPTALKNGMDSFVRFGCYGCHKLDTNKYPFMEHVRKKVAPPLDHIAVKTPREFSLKWVRNPKDYRADTRMPAFWGLSNNSHDFTYLFQRGGFDQVDHKAWNDAEVYAIVSWMYAESEKRAPKLPAVDLSQADPKRGERILVGFDAQDGHAKACIACHDVPITSPALQVESDQMRRWYDPATKTWYGWGARMTRRQGPRLHGLGSKLTPEWLVYWLKNPTHHWPETNMPDLRLTDQEARDVASYLLSLRNEEFDALPPVAEDQAVILRMAQELRVGESPGRTAAALGEVEAWTPEKRTHYVGDKLFKHYGCFGCHLVEDYATTTPVGAELTEWGSKLIARLEFNHAPIRHTRFDFAYTKLQNPRIYDWGMTRSDLPYERLRMPRFGFTPEEAKDISTFLVALVNDVIPEQAAFRPTERQQDINRGRQIVARYNCQGCHVIEGEGADVWPVIQDTKWRPPDLLGQGMKAQPDWLFRYLKDPAFVEIHGAANTDRVRPWHTIRMPTFHFTDEEARALVRYFSALSKVPADFETEEADSLVGPGTQYAQPKTLQLSDPKRPGKKIAVRVSNRLEEARALFREYQCKSCHISGGDQPIANQAPNFRHTMDGRLRADWLSHWLWGPGKLQLGTSMPAFFANENGPVAQDAQFFDGDPAAQVRAVRDYIRFHYREDD